MQFGIILLVMGSCWRGVSAGVLQSNRINRRYSFAYLSILRNWFT